MSGRYLTDLADVCRRAGLTVIEVGSGPSQVGTAWKNRARSSGGYASGRPSHVMVHHTASSPASDGWPDVNYCTFSSENRPVCNLYLARNGTVYVCAAGATNTNGKGGPIDNVAQDSMNTAAIGIEAGNTGTGEPWPAPQQDAYVVLAGALIGAYGLPYCRSHAEYAPDRKVDPAGPSRWAPSGGTWPMDAFRADLAGAPPAPTRKDPHVQCIIQQEGDTALWVSDLIYKRWCNNTANQEDLVRFEIGKAGLDSTTRTCDANEIMSYGIIAPGSPIPPPPPGYTGRDWAGRPTR